MESKSEEEIKYSFIKNQPLGEDLFENKSQEKIAKVISEKIINDPDFKVIGIDGEWGAGKSNLVRLIEKNLDSSHMFFIYDVWGHQEDEQRHAILSEITDFITKKNIIKGNNDWKEKLVSLTSKQKNTTTTNIPHLSIGFILSLLLIIYVPTVNTLAKDLNIWLKIPFVLLPIILLFILFIKFYFKYRAEGKSNNQNKLNRWGRFKKYGQDATQELFKVYHSQKESETKIELISEKEPTVKEFRSWMKQIDEDLNKKVVIVFDNFDRLPKKHIQSIWSSIHIFFAEENYDNIKVIIPFDREHVQNAFKELNGSDNKFGDDYINKTFDIVFRITLPIMSDWKKFFEDQWKKAFKNYDEEEYRLVVQAYEFLSRRITPREIISFINEILTIKLLDNKFKERYIAIFVLKKHEILESPLKAVTDFKDILGGLTSFYSNDKEYAKQLTAIIYHIDVENALELIYRQELIDSLVKNNIEQFNSICKSDFIDSIFVSSIAEIEVFENPIVTLDALSEETKVSSQHINQVWEFFYNRVLQIDSDVSKLQIDRWQITLIKKISDNKYLKNLLDKYFNLIDDSNIEHYIDLIDDLIIDLGEEKILNLLIKRNVSEKNYIKLIEYRGADFKKYKLSTDYKSLDEYLASLKIVDILKFKNSKFLPKEYDFIELKGILKSNLTTFIDQNNVESANDSLLKLKEISQKSGGLKNVLTDDKIYTLHVNNSSSKLPIINDLIAMRIANGNSFKTSYASKFSNVLNTEDEKIAYAVGNTILHYITYGDLLLSSYHFKTSPLFKQIILLMFKKTDLTKSANIVSLIEKYSEIKHSLEIEDNSLLKELNKWKVDKLDVNKLDDEFIDDCLHNPDLRISKDFLDIFNNEFKSLDKESYKTVFDNGTDVHFKYFSEIRLENLTQESLTIFENRLIEKLINTDIITKQWWYILEIYESNNSNLSIVNTFKNILDKILTAKIDLKVEDIIILFPYFIKYQLLDKQSDVFRLIIKNEFLSNSDFLQLLISNSDSIKTLYAAAIKTDKDNFRNLLNEKREENPEFETLAKVLDIRKSKSEKN